MKKRHKQMNVRSDVQAAFKVACAQKGTTMAAVLVKAMEKYCQEAGVEIEYFDDEEKSKKQGSPYFFCNRIRFHDKLISKLFIKMLSLSGKDEKKKRESRLKNELVKGKAR